LSQISTMFTFDERTTSFEILLNVTRSFGINNLPKSSISITFTPAINFRIKSLFFLLKRFSLFILSIIKFHSDIGQSSRQASKTERFSTKPSCKDAVNCFFKGDGNNSLPLASTLHSYVPIIVFNSQLFELGTKI